MSGIKTGTPGFVNPVDGKVYTVDPVKDGDSTVNPIANAVDPGDMTVDNTRRDIAPATRVTLGQYLSKATKGDVGSTSVANKYSIDEPTLQTPMSSLRTETGHPSPLTPPSLGNSEKFAGNLPSSISQDYAEAVSKSGNITTLISKGRGEETDTKKLLDGNDLFKAITVNQQNVVVLPGPLENYTKAAVDPNYRTSFVSFADFKTPPKKLDISLINLPNSYFINPNEEAVKTGQLTLNLSTAVKKVETLTGGTDPESPGPKNAYPVSIPVPFKLDNLASLSDANGFPTSLTNAGNQNAEVFKENLRSSISDNYANTIGNYPKFALTKGKSVSGEESLDGNQLLQSVVDTPGGVVLPEFLDKYDEYSIEPNFRFVNFEFAPSNVFQKPDFNFDLNLKLINPSQLLLKKPSEEVVNDISKLLSFDLQTRVKKVQLLTSGKDPDSPGPKNVYTVEADAPPNKPFASISSAEGKLPAPLTPASNPNLHAPNLQNAYSDKYNELKVGAESGLQKGKTAYVLAVPANPETPDGHRLLSNVSLNESKNIQTPAFLSTYIEKNLQSNVFNPGSIFGIDYSFGQEFIIPDISNAPSTFVPIINVIDVLGKYYGQPGDVIKKDVVTLEELKKKAIDSTVENEFPLGDNTANPLGFDSGQLISITDPVTKVPPPLNGFTNAYYYAEREKIKPESTDASLANTGFTKGKNVNAKYDGNNLLGTIKGNVDVVSDRFSTKYSSGASYQENSFDDTGSSEFKSDEPDQFGTPVNVADANAIPSDHPINVYRNNGGAGVLALGNSRFAPRRGVNKAFNPTLSIISTDGTKQAVSHMNMARIGIGLMQRGAGEIPAWNRGEFNPIGDVAEAGALLPSVAQLAILKIPNLELEARDVFDNLTKDKDDEYDVGGLVSISPFNNGQSWGTLNSPSEPYDAGIVSNAGLALLMIALITAVGLLFAGLSAIFAGQSRKATQSVGGEKMLGKYLFEPADEGSFTQQLDFNPFDILGLRKPANDFGLCLNKGAIAFFLGVDNPLAGGTDLIQGVLGQAVDALLSDDSKVGANIVVCRTIVRSGLMFAQSVEGIINQFENSALSGTKSIGTVLKVIRSSKIISAMNVFAGLGDALLDRARAIQSGYVIPLPDGKKKYVSGPDAYDPDNLDSAVKKNRLSRGKYDPTLAWSTQRAPAMYLIDQKTQGLSNITGLNSFRGPGALNQITKGGAENKNQIWSSGENNGRISDNYRKDFEELLDSAYVPFYFHDVRTNEIVSFHAFLASLNDEYSASYESVEGFGRVEPIKVYKGTTRKISMSFYIAALDDQDFDHMWTKINKLTTLLYPQYTQGRVLVSGKNQFIAPFSQLPGASPLIRIRLGDLLRSNYSKFALARLFGAGTAKNSLFKFNIPKKGDETTSVPISVEETQANRNARDNYLKNKRFTGDEKVEVNYIQNYITTTRNIPQEGNPSNEEIQKFMTVTHGIRQGFYEIKEAVVKDPGSRAIGPLDDVTYPVEITYESKDDADQSGTLTMTLPAGVLIPTDATINKLVPINEPNKDSLTEFMNPQKNAIVKSFESTAGKGLAGFIESMSFDWYEKTTWDVDPDRVAPKFCKVTLNFSPIHDITPGLDQSGYNRAPIYPVGRAMSSRNE